jgi:hypothetical protein
MAAARPSEPEGDRMTEHQNEYQSVEQAMDIMNGRMLKCLGPSSSTKTGRPQGFAFIDLVTGDAILVMVAMGALEAHIVPTPESQMTEDRDAAMTTFRAEAIDAITAAR